MGEARDSISTMADSSVLLNFAAGDLPVYDSAPKYKGGSWRERARLKNLAKSRSEGTEPESRIHGAESAHQRATKNKVNHSGTDFVGYDRPAKRRRENGEFRPALSSGANGNTSEPRTAPTKPLGNREVISSLFTYNPSSKAAEEPRTEENENATPAKPSNAPLPDGIDTFTSFGLSPTLAVHLLTKMELKNPTAIQKAAVSQLVNEDSDVFIQSETGSGKTLAYLLPIVQRIMTMAERCRHETGEEQGVHRDSGLFAVILAPTRELCKQISVVLERVLGCAHFIVAGTVIGGEKKKSEKARLRKGLNVLVATPGRLVDHLENTKTLDVSSVRYLVLDEGDRLMDLGFEEDITKIVKKLDSNKKKSERPGLPENRITVLCSATLKTNVQKLGDVALKDAVLVKGTAEGDDEADVTDQTGEAAFLAPAQLKQSYIVCAAKLRLVTLTALLRRTFARKGSVTKAIVFLSCADSVDFHFRALSRQDDSSAQKIGMSKQDKSGTDEESDDDGKELQKPAADNKPELEAASADAVSSSPTLSSSGNPLTLFKMHGSLPQATRTSIVKAFSKAETPSLLLATDVASRGLDLPNLDLVIEYDPAFSKEDHLHRIGRTARLGRDGRAIIFLLPGPEEGYVDVLKSSYRKTTDADGLGAAGNVTSQSATDILRKGFLPTSGVVMANATAAEKNWESKATDFQLDIERWVLHDPNVKELARKAFQSQIRAYATHIGPERKWFDIKELHLGHLAKAFGLRDPPGKINVVGVGRKSNVKSTDKHRGIKSGGGGSSQMFGTNDRGVNGGTSIGIGTVTGTGTGGNAELVQTAKRTHVMDDVMDAEDAAKKMRDAVRSNRKKMNVLGGGAEEFNIA